MPVIGAPIAVDLARRRPGTCARPPPPCAVCASVNCQPSSEPRQAMDRERHDDGADRRVEHLGVGEPERPGGFRQLGVRHDALDHRGRQDVDRRPRRACRTCRRAARRASGSPPRRSSAPPIPCRGRPTASARCSSPCLRARLRPCGFQAAAKVSPLNQNQPMIEIRPTGRITPQTVTEPMRPVMAGPPKLATVVSHSSAITPDAGGDRRRGQPREEAGEVAHAPRSPSPRWRSPATGSTERTTWK